MEADLAVVVGAGWRRELPDGFYKGRQLPVVGADTCVEFRWFRGQRVMIDEHSPQAHEGADEDNSHRDCVITLKYVRGLDRAIFREGQRPELGVLSTLQGRSLRP